MTEVAERGAFGAKKLVLGFDAGCMTCSELARKIEEEVGDKLEVRSLHDPQMVHWREQALGEDAPWAPTLIEAKGGEVRAWIGLKMALMLSRRLGPVGTWRVMQVVGEIKSAPKAATASSIGLSRGQFIKNLGGAALGVGVLSATGGLASPALAAEDEIDEEGLAEAFSIIEEIPDSVVARGNRATKQWLQNKLQEKGAQAGGVFQTQGVIGCAAAIGTALVLNLLPITKILKIRAAIRAVGGARRFARLIIRFYRRGRRQGRSRRGAIRYAARRAADASGKDVRNALLALFSLGGVAEACF